MQAVSTFSVTGWEQTPWGDDEDEDDGPQLSRAIVRKKYHGGLEGEGIAELFMCQADPEDLAAGAGYVASERFIGRLEGLTGSFVLQHGGLSGGGAPPRTFGNIVPGSGTGELVGLAGESEITVDEAGKHTLILNYSLT